MSKMTEEKDRLYFIVKSWLMGQIGTVIFFVFVLFLGKIDFVQGVIIGFISFTSSLVILRLFEKSIVGIVEKIIGFLYQHKSLKDFILKHF